MIAANPVQTRPPTTNSCRVCSPLGASLVARGIRNCMPLLHGSQGCATYIRRYLISHFREPMDVASSAFSEHTAVFGGQANLFAAIDNLTSAYSPELILIGTTCLAETIGEDVPGLIKRYQKDHPQAPALVHVSTPSYSGCHREGWRATLRALCTQMPVTGAPGAPLALFPSQVSCADLRHLRELAAAFGVEATLVPDYSDTLDGPTLAEYHAMPVGGTGIEALRGLASAKTAIELSATPIGAGGILAHKHAARVRLTGLPIGVRATDRFCALLKDPRADLERAFVPELPPALAMERGRLLDAYVDGHKYVTGKRVAVVGDADLSVALCGWLAEIGCVPVLLGTGAADSGLAAALAAVGCPDTTLLDDHDHDRLGAAMAEAAPQLILGPSKCYPVARSLGIPLLRVGFPVHDRIGAGRMLHLGYRGTLRLFDDLVNTLLGTAQDAGTEAHAYL